MTRWELIEGDCVKVMRGLEAGSFHAIVTDPPYGIEFMGHAWDTWTVGEAVAPGLAEVGAW